MPGKKIRTFVKKTWDNNKGTIAVVASLIAVASTTLAFNILQVVGPIIDEEVQRRLNEAELSALEEGE